MRSAIAKIAARGGAGVLARIQALNATRRTSVGNRLRAFVAMLFSVCWLAGLSAAAQTGPSQDATRYGQDELDQLLAPIALYPDQLLAQVLIASTYPFEVALAARFVQQNPGLAGDALDEALAQRNWDPSVQSLAAFPQVLAMMNEKLEWTQRLGDAFLADQQRVMDTVQSLRKRAEAAGNLYSTPQQTVMSEQSEITIQPTQPDIVYVPVYDPQVIYGPWWAPEYPPWFWYPPPIYGYPGWPVFGIGIWFGTAWVVSHHHWGWTHADWHGHHIAVHPTDNRFWNRQGRPPPPGGDWQHSPEHRRGVAYRDPPTRDRFAPVDPNAVRARESFRGHDLAAPPAGALRPNATAGEARAIPPVAPSRAASGGLSGAPSQRPSSGAITAAPARSVPPTSSMQQLPSGASRLAEPARPVAPAPSTQARPVTPPATAQVRPIAPPATTQLRSMTPPSSPQVRPVAPPASVFDPGLSRQQAQVNAQRGVQSRSSIASPPLAASRAPIGPSTVYRPPVSPGITRAPAPSGMSRAPAPSGISRSPSSGGGAAPAPSRSR